MCNVKCFSMIMFSCFLFHFILDVTWKIHRIADLLEISHEGGKLSKAEWAHVLKIEDDGCSLSSGH